MPVASQGADLSVNTLPLTKDDQPLPQFRTGTNTAEPQRTHTWQVKISGLAIVAVTGTAVKAPSAGKTLVLLGWDFSNTAAGSAKFSSGSVGGTTLWQTGIKAATAMNSTVVNFGNGVKLPAADAALWLTLSADGTITGTIWGTEE
jgi:hypothetical protein